MKRIYSAGGIVFKDDGDGLKVLVAQHSGHKGWDFPKGHIGIGETAEVAAVREVEEETGVKAQVIESVGRSEYFYFDPPSHEASGGKERVFKTVTYFLMKYIGQGRATTAFEVSDLVWLGASEVDEKLSFKGSKEVWEKAKEKIRQLTTDINS